MGNLREFHKALPNENKDGFLVDVSFSTIKFPFLKLWTYNQ